SGRFRRGGAAIPTGNHHPGVEYRSEDGVALNQQADLLVAELTRIVDEAAAVRMAGPDRAVVDVERFKKGVVAEVGDIENDPEFVHFPNQIGSSGAKSPDLIVSHRIPSDAVVRGSHRSQARGVGALEVVHRDDG